MPRFNLFRSFQSKRFGSRNVFDSIIVLSVILFLSNILLIAHSLKAKKPSARETTKLVSSPPAIASNRTEDPPTCFTAADGACRIVPCGGSYPPGAHFRGHVHDLSNESFPGSRRSGLGAAYGGQCAVSEEHRFTYIHAMKSGGSSVHRLLRSALCRLANASAARPEAKDFECAPSGFRQASYTRHTSKERERECAVSARRVCATLS